MKIGTTILVTMILTLSQSSLAQIASTNTSTPARAWVLIGTEETKGGRKETYKADGDWLRVLHRSRSNHIWTEVITLAGNPISDIGWHENDSKQHERLYRSGKCVTNVSWYASGQKQREWVYSNGLCTASFAWYASGQMSEKNLHDKEGRYLAAPRWYPNGKLKYEADFKNGKAVKRTFYKKDGTLDRMEEDKDIQQKN